MKSQDDSKKQLHCIDNQPIVYFYDISPIRPEQKPYLTLQDCTCHLRVHMIFIPETVILI